MDSDTVKLLRECDAGIKMGVGTINDVIDYVASPRFSQMLRENRDGHNAILREVQTELEAEGEGGKEPPAMAKGMEKIKTNVKLALDTSDGTIADLVTDGCNMGVKSLGRYLNEYGAASEKSKDIAARLISLEANLADGIREFL